LSTIAITKSIIVVDDEHDLVDLFSDALSSYGYDVSAFTDPILALESIKGNPGKYSLLITDFMMNKMNGCELGIKVKELNHNIQVILITVYENIDGNVLNFEHINKPITIQTLLEKVNDYLKK
jgi:two-component system, cell cycle sensor histidine kinase and response regulator CckA